MSETVLRKVTPDEAQLWRATSRQPSVRSERVEMYVDAMVSGLWDPTLHRLRPVKFRQGRLRNGNHRCAAVVAFGRPVEMWVMGEPPEVSHVDPV